MASRNLTAAYLRHREATRSHKSIRNKTNMELRDFKVQKNLLAAHSDDEGSTVDARVYSVPPMWVSLVDDMNRDISQIKIKLSELNTSAGKALLPGFADDDDSEDLVGNTIGEVKGLFQDCERKLKELIKTKSEGSQDETLQLVMAERMTEEREKAITKVAESVNDLAEIFKEIQVLVIDQGTILDRIDYNIEQAADRVVAARGEIEKANDYQKKSRTMMCIYLLLVMCGFMVCILIVKKMALGA